MWDSWKHMKNPLFLPQLLDGQSEYHVPEKHGKHIVEGQMFNTIKTSSKNRLDRKKQKKPTAMWITVATY